MNSTRDASNTFYPDFLQYEGEPFVMTNSKRKRFETETSFLAADESSDEITIVSKEKSSGKLINSELRRQIHIQSEQKRRAQIKDGFEDLRNELPSCLNKKMSKVALLHRSKKKSTFFYLHKYSLFFFYLFFRSRSTYSTLEKYANDHLRRT